MRQMRSIYVRAAALAAAALLAAGGCVPVPYGYERQQTFYGGQHPVWAVAPAVNLSGERQVDPILQADLLFQQLQAVNNLTVIPVDRVVQVYAALRITKVESPEQAAIVCEQLGCDALVVPTITIYDPYNPPKLSASLALLTRTPMAAADVPKIDARELAREATPTEDQALPQHPPFVQVVGMYDAVNGSVHAAVLAYAAGRTDAGEPLGPNEYFQNMDRYCGFVYHTLVGQLLDRVSPPPPPPPPQ
jgi:hypothetical protein